VATGYGLVDERDKEKYPAYDAFITMIKLLKDATLIEFDLSDEIKYFKFQKEKTIKIFWSKDGVLQKQELAKMLNIYGKNYTNENFMYAIEERR
jgi:hypothetical protein